MLSAVSRRTSLLELEICIFVWSLFVFVYFYVGICVFAYLLCWCVVCEILREANVSCVLRWSHLCGRNPTACLFVSNCLCGFVILFVFVWICFVCEILKEALTSCVMSCSQRFGRSSPLLLMEIHHIPNDEYFVKPRSLLWSILIPPYEYFVLNNKFTRCWNSQ